MSDQPSTNPVRFPSLARLAPRFQIYFLLGFNLFLLLMLYNFSLSEKTDLPLDGVVFLFFLLIWRWDIIGFWLAYLCLLLFLLIVGHVWGWPYVCLFVAILGFIYLVIRIHPRKAAVTLQFPLRGGLFYTVHGGSFGLTNYHGRFVKAQRYACDFVRINRLGTYSLGIYPPRLHRYAAFGVTICAPINGAVKADNDGLPDLPPGKVDNGNVFGNHVVIQPDDTDVLVILAHMQKDSVVVKTGDRVTAGQPIGKVGNSGRTFEPHLHIHAQRLVTKDGKSEWVPVPIRFGSRWLVRNSLVRA
jgi:hypothetical protein